MVITFEGCEMGRKNETARLKINTNNGRGNARRVCSRVSTRNMFIVFIGMYECVFGNTHIHFHTPDSSFGKRGGSTTTTTTATTVAIDRPTDRPTDPRTHFIVPR